MYKDGAGASYDAATANLFTTVPFGSVLVNPLNPGAGMQANPTGLYFEMFNFGTTASFAQKADNSVAGEMRDCGECHVGGGMMEYVIDPAKATSGTYNPASRTSLRDYTFGSAITAFNALIDIFNPDPARRGTAVVQDYGQSGVLEMDCLICHMKDYSWEARKDAVRKGEFDASRAAGARLVKGIVNGTTVFYNNTSVTANPNGQLVVDLSSRLRAVPDSNNCAACHQSQYNVDWKKRGEQWLEGTEVHMGIGCMGCHERSDMSAPTVGTEGTVNNKLGLCDPAKGGNSAFDALWNKLDAVNFKNCVGCHEPAGTPAFETYGAPNSATVHALAGLTAKIAYDKNGNPASHMDLIDCTACHIRKTFDGGAFVDGTGADAEGRVALHDEPQVARDMTNGNALYWDNGKLYAANLLTSFFIRDMNGMDDANNGLDANNDGRNAGMDPLLQTHVNDINIASGRKAVTMEQNADGSWVNESEIGGLFTALLGDGMGTASSGAGTYPGGIKQLLGINDAADAKKLLPKISFLMVPFKTSHNIAPTTAYAWGKKKPDGSYGCDDCHGANKGFYNGTYPIKGNMDGYDDSGSNYKFRFRSDQVTAFTKVNGLADVTDSHPNVVNKKGDRTVPVPMLTRFDTPYVAGASAVSNQTLRNIDRSEVIYEQTFQTRDTAWYTSIAGTAPPAACSGSTSPFYCADPLGTATAESAKKSLATSTKGWLLKVEVRTAGDADASHISFRTAQLGKDNATSMSDVLAALPASFKSNTDFAVTESGGALTITAAAGKEIRISPLSDVGPFGLKGKLWKADPIVRGTNSYATRDAYVAYLNTLTDAAPFGIGVIPKANFQVTDADQVVLGTQVIIGQAIGITGTDPNTNDPSKPWIISPGAAYAQPNSSATAPTGDVGTVAYSWGTSEAGAITSGGNTRTPTIVFSSPGSKTITLTATNAATGVSSHYGVTVTAEALPISIAWDSPSKTATIANLPDTTKYAKIYWGDGALTTRTISVGTTTTSAAHTYTSATTKIIQVYAYNSAGTKVGYYQASITP